MARYRKRRRLDATTRHQLLADFAQALSVIRSPEEGAKLMQDLLTEPEAEMLAKRLAIADLLLEGFRYEDIQRALNVSPPTIARVNAWLAESGEGFALVRKRKKPIDIRVRTKRRRRRSLGQYFWPGYLIEEILEQASDSQRTRLVDQFKKLDRKSSLYKELAPLFKQYSR